MSLPFSSVVNMELTLKKRLKYLFAKACLERRVTLAYFEGASHDGASRAYGSSVTGIVTYDSDLDFARDTPIGSDQSSTSVIDTHYLRVDITDFKKEVREFSVALSRLPEVTKDYCAFLKAIFFAICRSPKGSPSRGCMNGHCVVLIALQCRMVTIRDFLVEVLNFLRTHDHVYDEYVGQRHYFGADNRALRLVMPWLREQLQAGSRYCSEYEAYYLTRRANWQYALELNRGQATEEARARYAAQP